MIIANYRMHYRMIRERGGEKKWRASRRAKKKEIAHYFPGKEWRRVQHLTTPRQISITTYKMIDRRYTSARFKDTSEKQVSRRWVKIVTRPFSRAHRQEINHNNPAIRSTIILIAHLTFVIHYTRPDAIGERVKCADSPDYSKAHRKKITIFLGRRCQAYKSVKIAHPHNFRYIKKKKTFFHSYWQNRDNDNTNFSIKIILY